MEQLPHLATLAALLQQAPNAQYIIFSTNTQTSSIAEWNKLQRWITGIFSPTAHAQLSREIQEWNSSKVMILEEWRLFKKLPKRSLKKSQISTGFEPAPTRYYLGALPTELRSHMFGARHILESLKFFFPVKESDYDFDQINFIKFILMKLFHTKSLLAGDIPKSLTSEDNSARILTNSTTTALRLTRAYPR